MLAGSLRAIPCAMAAAMSRSSTTTMSKPVLRGVVFDMDGTLTKPNLDFKEMYRRANVPLDEDILEAIAHMPPLERQRAQSVIEEMENEGRHTLELMPGAIDLARWLQMHGVPTALVTRNTARTVQHLHKTFWTPAGLPALSPAISRDDDTLPSKPNPAAMTAIASEWGVPLGPGLLMVGDSPSNDVGFGKAAGVSTALLDTGRRLTEGGADGGADIVVDALARLPHRIWERFELPSGLAAPLTKYPQPEPASAASLAAARGDVDALRGMAHELLCAADADGGNTPLIWAADRGHARAVQLLLQTAGSAEVNRRGFLGATAVARASRGGHTAALEVLLGAEGVDPNLANHKQQSPLHFAAFKGHPAAVDALLSHPACNPFVLDRKGRTPAEDTKEAAIRAAIEAAQLAVLSAVPNGEMNV